MATQSTGSASFLANLGKVYGTYTGAFIGFTILLAILEQVGVPNKWIGYAFVFLTIFVYAYIGYLSRTMEISEYYVAGRSVPAFYNGMATGADWMSAASFISMAGGLFLAGYNGLGYVLGWTGGYVLVAILLAPYLRKFGQFTVPDFLGTRYEGNVARICGVVVLFCASFTYIVAQAFGIGIITSRFLGIPFEFAIFAGLIGILVCSMLGGMRAVTWTQVAQYIILIIAYLVPVVWLSTKKYGIPIPELTYGQALSEIGALEEKLNIVRKHIEPFVDATGKFSWVEFNNFWALVLCLMVGTASLPHILMRYFTTPNVREARQSVAWSIFFIFLLYFTAPAYAAFAKLEVYQNVIGAQISTLPAWVQSWSQVGGLLTINDLNGNGILEVTKYAVAGAFLDLGEIRINQDIIVLSMPEVAGLPYVISGLVAAGGLAAALSTADGLLLAIANALSHDVYYKMINPQASTKRRLMVARTLLVGVAILAAAVAGTRPSGIIQMVAWAFSLAAAGLFAPLVMGIWWKRTTTVGAIVGMIAGFGVCMFYLIATHYFAMPLWFGIRNISSALFGLPVAFIVTWLVSLVTTPPSPEMQDFVDSIRVPRGEVRFSGSAHE
ncbi:cation/acetate symporter [Stella humosa]|uniref:Cation/acetate symporter n=1 Tax=Stella humosa TaxID=94 RepID=A0A3N1KNU4_9PROT|nr:sodium:solute symporter family protein [Stella humosa]ROP81017.1 cation/acetate symporter [Stella humosa]BBK29707.1 sodium:solute symporter [Stella humosa]